MTEIWNSVPGVKPVQKFKDRVTGVNRVWQALQRQQAEVVPDVAPAAARAAPKKATRGKPAKGGEEAPAARDSSKKGKILDLIRQPEGATLAAIRGATAWQAHSVRGFLSGTLGKKIRLKVESAKVRTGSLGVRAHSNHMPVLRFPAPPELEPFPIVFRFGGQSVSFDFAASLERLKGIAERGGKPGEVIELERAETGVGDLVSDPCQHRLLAIAEEGRE